MKFKFEKLIPNDKVKALIEVYENDGYSLKYPFYTTESEDWKSINLSMSVIFQKGNIEGCLQLPKEWFKEKELLKPYVWYPAEEFDGNPNGYVLLQKQPNSYLCVDNDPWDENYAPGTDALSDSTTHFMYTERVRDKENEIKPKLKKAYV